MSREKLFSVTAIDCVFTPYRGSGAGGQKRNKTSSAMRCVHPASGAVGECEEHREQTQNKKIAFTRMAESAVFQHWLRMETLRVTGKLREIETEVDAQMKKVKIEVKDDLGRWVEENEEG